MALLLIILIIGLVAYTGYRFGAWGTDVLNRTMRSEINLLKAHNFHWSNEARNKYELMAYNSQERTKDMSLMITNLMQLLQAIQREQGQNLTTQENQKITQLINQARQAVLN